MIYASTSLLAHNFSDSKKYSFIKFPPIVNVLHTWKLYSDKHSSLLTQSLNDSKAKFSTCPMLRIYYNRN